MASNEAKARGNAAFTAQRYEEAVAAFSEGIAVDPDNHILYRYGRRLPATKQTLCATTTRPRNVTPTRSLFS